MITIGDSRILISNVNNVLRRALFDDTGRTAGSVVSRVRDHFQNVD